MVISVFPERREAIAVEHEGFKPAAWHHLRLEMKGDRLSGAVDGKPLAVVTHGARAKGMAFLASTYDHNLFDNVRVGPLPVEGQGKP